MAGRNRKTVRISADQTPTREALADWKEDYNTVRPHSAIGNVPPAIYAKLSDPEMQHGSNEGRALLPTG